MSAPVPPLRPVAKRNQPRMPSVAERIDFNISCIEEAAKTLAPDQLSELAKRIEHIAWTYCYPPAAPASSDKAAT